MLMIHLSTATNKLQHNIKKAQQRGISINIYLTKTMSFSKMV